MPASAAWKPVFGIFYRIGIDVRIVMSLLTTLIPEWPKPGDLPMKQRLVDESDLSLLTDLYELTMLQAYWHLGMREAATFSLFVRRLPKARNYLLACGIDDALDCIAALRFEGNQIEYLGTLGLFRSEFLDWLRNVRFTGDVFAVEEGTPVFAEEPMIEVVAPIAEAQLIETIVMNQVHMQTVIASKAVRVVSAAQGRTIVDFGLRRAPGVDAGLKLARASFIAGVHATSDVLAGQRYGIPVSGTMAHSFIQSFDDEAEAFRVFAQLYPNTTLLVDTYDTLAGVRKVIELARRMGKDFNVRAVRLDSGDMIALAREARRLLDDAGLPSMEIFASGSLDEYVIRDMLAAGAPIDGFGVGTRLAVSADAPALDSAYKLTTYGGQDRLKLSTAKRSLPGQKQVFRQERVGRAAGDVIARFEETLPGVPLLRKVMARGERLAAPLPLNALQLRTAEQIAALPAEVRALEPATTPYEVAISPALEKAFQKAASGYRDGAP